MRNFLADIDVALEIYTWVLLAVAALGVLAGFNAISMQNRAVAALAKILDALTNWIRRPINALVPDLGGVDISALILIGLIITLRYTIALYVMRRIA